MRHKSLLIDRLLIAQGAMTVFEKNLSEALILAKEYVRLGENSADDQEYEDYEAYAEGLVTNSLTF